MTWLFILAIVGVVVTLTLWVMFVCIAVREIKTEMPTGSFAPALKMPRADEPALVKVLLPIDGSAASIAAIQEVAHCPLPPGSPIELPYAIHSRLPVILDFPPWAVTIAAAHGESIRAQTQHAPEVLGAAATHLRTHQRHATVLTKTVEGVPKEQSLREAIAWGADRIVLGSHGRGHAQRAVLGSTASAVAADAPCASRARAAYWRAVRHATG